MSDSRVNRPLVLKNSCSTMTMRNIYSWVRSSVVLCLGLFTCICCFDCLYSIGMFFIPCFIATTAINLCLSLRIRFKPRKRERIIAIVYLILFVLSFHALLLLNGFGLFNFKADAERWDIVRIYVSVLFTDYCAIWLAVRCALFLRKGQSRLLMDTAPTRQASD